MDGQRVAFFDDLGAAFGQLRAECHNAFTLLHTQAAEVGEADR